MEVVRSLDPRQVKTDFVRSRMSAEILLLVYERLSPSEKSQRPGFSSVQVPAEAGHFLVAAEQEVTR